MRKKLTKEQIAAMSAVGRKGADIYNRALAVRLREVERNHPGYIVITRPMMPQVGPCRPYFGAILTKTGSHAITPRKIIRSRKHTSSAIEVRA